MIISEQILELWHVFVLIKQLHYKAEIHTLNLKYRCTNNANIDINSPH